jgi:hypothetical protein
MGSFTTLPTCRFMDNVTDECWSERQVRFKIGHWMV